MCGLAGYIGKPVGERENATLRLLFNALESRGKDGHGYMAYYPGKGAKIYKDCVPVHESGDSLDFRGATAVLLHARLASSGGKQAYDCHPHTSGSVIIVHNGHIGNDKSARSQLKVPESAPSVDSYLISYIIGNAPDGIAAGIRAAFTHLYGSLTFLVFSPRSPMTIWAASNNGQLHHFRFRGGDYFCSTPELFQQAVCEWDRWGMDIPAYKESRPLRGIYQISPYNIKQLMYEEELKSLYIPKRQIVTTPKTTTPIQTILPEEPLTKKQITRLGERIGKAMEIAKRGHGLKDSGYNLGKNVTFYPKDVDRGECELCRTKPARVCMEDVDMCWDCARNMRMTEDGYGTLTS